MPSKLEVPKPSASPDKFEIENWCRTLMEAAEIQADPEKMKLCGPMMEKKRSAINSIAGLRAKAKSMPMEDEEDDSED